MYLLDCYSHRCGAYLRDTDDHLYTKSWTSNGSTTTWPRNATARNKHSMLTIYNHAQLKNILNWL